MTFMSVDVPERIAKRLSELRGRGSEEGRDKWSTWYTHFFSLEA